ncbi:MAG: hypothetical protein HC927_03955 [Deltaproteobacteria bacterium]|nr:hypothetical protein [Deltaproteobacteria bacterium]
MTIARRILNHTTWLITRRCSERRFFLLPTSQVKQVFEYALARAARITGVLLHAWTVMPNHYHLVVTDPQGRLPEFVRRLNALVARALNFRYRRKESFWKSGSYNAVELLTEESVLDKMIYTLANPVSAGLVAKAWHWREGGASTSMGIGFGGRRWVLRPAFVRGGEEVETLHLVAPPSCGSSDAEFAERLRAGLHAREGEVRTQMQAEGRRFMGMEAVLAQSWNQAPRSEEAFGRMQPRFATRDGEVMRAAIRAWKEWVAAYRCARQRFCEGDREVEFPAGTYLLKVAYGVRVAET